MRQASDTPFANGSVGDVIQWDGSEDLADRLVNRKHLPYLAHLDSTIQAYLEGIAAANMEIIDSVNLYLLLEKYKDFWGRKDNRTTSPFGIYTGHYKSVIDK